jgi:hypothetical protein
MRTSWGQVSRVVTRKITAPVEVCQGFVGVTKPALHLGLLSQCTLAVYMNLFLHPPSHPTDRLPYALCPEVDV